jgi:hypothetical protein
MIGNRQGKTEISLDGYLSWMSRISTTAVGPRVPANLRSKERKPMRTIRTLLHQRPTAALLTLAIVFAVWQCPARAQGYMPNTALKTQQTPTGRIVWRHVRRVFVNPNGQFVYVGYLFNIDPIGGSLFDGSPSESTAYFTFSTDLAQLTPLPNNNDVALDLVSAGTFSVYYNGTLGAAPWSPAVGQNGNTGLAKP